MKRKEEILKALKGEKRKTEKKERAKKVKVMGKEQGDDGRSGGESDAWRWMRCVDGSGKVGLSGGQGCVGW